MPLIRMCVFGCKTIVRKKAKMLKVTSGRPRSNQKENQQQQFKMHTHTPQNIYQLCHYFEKWHSTTVNGFALVAPNTMHHIGK